MQQSPHPDKALIYGLAALSAFLGLTAVILGCLYFRLLSCRSNRRLQSQRNQNEPEHRSQNDQPHPDQQQVDEPVHPETTLKPGQNNYTQQENQNVPEYEEEEWSSQRGGQQLN